MHKGKGIFHIIFFLSGYLLKQGSALKCYYCDYDSASGLTSGCKGPVVASEHIISCEEYYSHCVVSNITVSNGRYEVQRYCLYADTSRGCRQEASGKIVCWCDTDNCNGLKTLDPKFNSTAEEEKDESDITDNTDNESDIIWQGGSDTTSENPDEVVGSPSSMNESEQPTGNSEPELSTDSDAPYSDENATTLPSRTEQDIDSTRSDKPTNKNDTGNDSTEEIAKNVPIATSAEAPVQPTQQNSADSSTTTSPPDETEELATRSDFNGMETDQTQQTEQSDQSQDTTSPTNVSDDADPSSVDDAEAEDETVNLSPTDENEMIDNGEQSANTPTGTVASTTPTTSSTLPQDTNASQPGPSQEIFNSNNTEGPTNTQTLNENKPSAQPELINTENITSQPDPSSSPTSSNQNIEQSSNTPASNETDTTPLNDLKLGQKPDNDGESTTSPDSTEMGSEPTQQTEPSNQSQDSTQSIDSTSNENEFPDDDSGSDETPLDSPPTDENAFSDNNQENSNMTGVSTTNTTAPPMIVEPRDNSNSTANVNETVEANVPDEMGLPVFEIGPNSGNSTDSSSPSESEISTEAPMVGAEPVGQNVGSPTQENNTTNSVTTAASIPPEDSNGSQSGPSQEIFNSNNTEGPTNTQTLNENKPSAQPELINTENIISQPDPSSSPTSSNQNIEQSSNTPASNETNTTPLNDLKLGQKPDNDGESTTSPDSTEMGSEPTQQTEPSNQSQDSTQSIDSTSNENEFPDDDSGSDETPLDSPPTDENAFSDNNQENNNMTGVSTTNTTAPPMIVEPRDNSNSTANVNETVEANVPDEMGLPVFEIGPNSGNSTDSSSPSESEISTEAPMVGAEPVGQNVGSPTQEGNTTNSVTTAASTLPGDSNASQSGPSQEIFNSNNTEGPTNTQTLNEDKPSAQPELINTENITSQSDPSSSPTSPNMSPEQSTGSTFSSVPTIPPTQRNDVTSSSSTASPSSANEVISPTPSVNGSYVSTTPSSKPVNNSTPATVINFTFTVSPELATGVNAPAPTEFAKNSSAGENVTTHFVNITEVPSETDSTSDLHLSSVAQTAVVAVAFVLVVSVLVLCRL